MILPPDILAKIDSCQILARRVVESLPLPGIHRSARTGESVEFHQYRNYMQGDDLRHLDWRLLARSDTLAIRTQTPDSPMRVGIVVDASASMAYCGESSPCSKFKLASILAAALAYIAMGQGDEVSLHVYQDGLLPGSGIHTGLAEFCHSLEEVEPAGEGRADAALARCSEQVAGRGVAFWISDFLDGEDALGRRLRGLSARAQGVTAFQILDPDERSFPFSSARRFLDPEDSRRRVDAFPEQSRQEYLERFGAHQELVRGICLREETRFESLDFSDDLAGSLARAITVPHIV